MNRKTDNNTRKPGTSVLFLVIFTLSLFFFAGCSDYENPNEEKEAALLAAAVIAEIWDVIDPDVAYPGFTYNGLSPACSSCPPVRGRIYDPNFYFFYKEGTVNRLLLFFEGGGMCWDITNCVYNHTYSEEVSFDRLMLGFLSTGFSGVQFENYTIGGILDATDERNPFKDWHMVYIPYCTGDLGIGQKDNVYVDDYGGGPSVTIRHRGAVNVQAVLRWLSDNLPSPDEVFVTGASAGSMSSFFNLPFIRELYDTADMTWYGDSAVGVLGEDDDNKDALDFAVENWGALPPDVVPAFSGFDINDFTVRQLYYEIIDEYNTVNFATYTTDKDATQAWFYNIQKDSNIDNPDSWGLESEAMPSQAILSEWNGLMETLLGNIYSDSSANYRYYIGTGTDHTMIYSDKFYLEDTGGQSFLT